MNHYTENWIISEEKYIEFDEVKLEYSKIFSWKEKNIRRGLALHVDYCPIESRIFKGKPYANVLDDCSSCEYHLDLYSDDDNGILYCFGKKISGVFQI